MAMERYQYRPVCSVPGCGQPAIYKVGAPWSDGTSRELKNYGLSCERHREAQSERARSHSRGLKLAEGETLGEVCVYRLETGRRDSQLKPATESRT